MRIIVMVILRIITVIIIVLQMSVIPSCIMGGTGRGTKVGVSDGKLDAKTNQDPDNPDEQEEVIISGQITD